MESETFLDTHVALWLYGGSLDLLSPKAKEIAESFPLVLSPVTLLEMDFLREIKKITVGGQKVFQSLEELLDLKIAENPFLDVIRKAAKLSWTRDPFDRLLVAHAMHRGSALLTKDRLILKHYSRALW